MSSNEQIFSKQFEGTHQTAIAWGVLAWWVGHCVSASLGFALHLRVLLYFSK